MALTFGKTLFFATDRTISSMKSNDERSGVVAAMPPERQLSPLQLQPTSFGSSLSLHAVKRGAIPTVSSSAPARNAAEVSGPEQLARVLLDPATTNSTRGKTPVRAARSAVL